MALRINVHESNRRAYEAVGSVLSARAFPHKDFYLVKVKMEDGGVYSGFRVAPEGVALPEGTRSIDYHGKGAYTIGYVDTADRDSMNPRPKVAFKDLSARDMAEVIDAGIKAVDDYIGGGSGEVVLKPDLRALKAKELGFEYQDFGDGKLFRYYDPNNEISAFLNMGAHYNLEGKGEVHITHVYSTVFRSKPFDLDDSGIVDVLQDLKSLCESLDKWYKKCSKIFG